MNARELWDGLQNPRRTYRRYELWRDRQRQKCIVKIDNPPMKIKGKPYRNQMKDPLQTLTSFGGRTPQAGLFQEEQYQTPLRIYYAFFGVPYAQPPIGPLRFKPPKPIEPTTGRIPLLKRIPLIKAYETENASFQGASSRTQQYRGSEDCLYLNIYVPMKPQHMLSQRPVLVYIHGGGFHRGSGDWSDIQPDAIMHYDLIFVTINYRLNIFGFLNTGMEECSGNMGLKDQTAALKWIQANIDRFGGDPTNVTIAGHSAGASCVNLHMISPLSKGLFRRAIVQGGGIYCPWGYQGDNQRPKVLFANHFQMIENDFRNVLIDSLRDSSAEYLLGVARKIKNDAMRLEPKRFMVFCGPTLEKHGGEDAFIPRSVEDLMKEAEPVPIIAGIVSQEGYQYIFRNRRKYRNGFDNLVRNDDEFAAFLAQNLRWYDTSARRHMDTIRKRYFPNLETMDSFEIQQHLATLCMDIWFRRFYDNFRLGPTGQIKRPLFVYQFCYLARKHNLRRAWRCKDMIQITAPTHGDEIMYLFKPQHLIEISDGRLRLEVRHMIDHMCSMWASFCYYGLPKSDVDEIGWKSYTDDKPYYLHIGRTSFCVPTRMNEVRWTDLNELVEQEPEIEEPCTPLLESAVFDFFPDEHDETEQPAADVLP